MQTILETVVKHLLKQKVRALSAMGLCQYRGENNTSCAIGCLLTDEEYFPSMENKGISQLVFLKKLPIRFNDVSTKFLESLQVLHDGNEIFSLQNTDFMAHVDEICQLYALKNVWKV